jgi:cell division protein FtsI/penicillin-binding protein 2
MSTIASGGVLMRPQIIRQIRDASDSVVYQYGPVEIDRVVSVRTAQRMAKLLQGVASPIGTAPEAAIKINGVDYEVAGKTGTAQKYLPEVQPSGRVKIVPSRKHHVASFVGFFPASRPQVAISVIIDDADARCPGGVAYGAKVAGPVFKSIGEKLIPILSITPPNQPARVDFVATAEGGRR